jgi:hypothetical protein
MAREKRAGALALDQQHAAGGVDREKRRLAVGDLGLNR